MTAACFADAYYFFGLLNPKDEVHEQVVRFNAELSRPIVTTAWILTELADGLAATPSRKLIATLVQRLTQDPRVSVIPASQSLFDRGMRLYESRSDKRWSLTDCISFVVMRERAIVDALTADHHFEQAGFTALLKGR